ncbi:hypothetical protein GIB67_042434 [Kingdonia uniflora]|uniref:tRNA-splicing endonuclease subunit Sen54 N-terminal domain-containing protein n=1 Tax=Kingdonia uniflora TaxID=39325 RepID=A0A7J7M896_9MAGN|nr:hypothetical protein GIB67_042434 [Kingdonia uniflora]
MYEMVGEKNNGRCWESFEAYMHLKSLGYIVGRHGVPWSMKKGKRTCGSASPQSTQEKNELYIRNKVNPRYVPKTSSDLKLVYYYICRFHPPSNHELEDLERKCNGIPLKFCHIEHGRMSFFSLNKIEFPLLP